MPTIEALRAQGWADEQLRWSPEWRVPRTPHDAAKREDGHSFSGFPVDLAIFDSPEGAGDWRNLIAICEFKAPDVNSGISQLEIYLSLEPRARVGYWTNGSQSTTVYKLADGAFASYANRGVPYPSDNFERPSVRPLTYKDLVPPPGNSLRSIFRRLLDVVVVKDSRSTRADGQLNQICNLLLLKLESDTTGATYQDEPLKFQLREGGEAYTARAVREEFRTLIKRRPEVFQEQDETELVLDDHTIQEAVYELSNLDLLDVGPEAVSTAFQVFRRANLKAGEGQYFTPQRIIKSAVEIMDIRTDEKIIDPACGTGGFLIEAFRAATSKANSASARFNARTWAHRYIYGVDKDAINVKLARAVMVILGDGSAHIHVGDSVREDRWKIDYPHLSVPLTDGSFDVVITNPPFGKRLKVSRTDAQRNKYSIAKAAARQTSLNGSKSYAELEIGLIFLERAHRLLSPGGRLGIVLPETYFFSATYSWLPGWLAGRFLLRGVLNIPMEAFQGFCRAKTNFYIFEKV